MLPVVLGCLRWVSGWFGHWTVDWCWSTSLSSSHVPPPSVYKRLCCGFQYDTLCKYHNCGSADSQKVWNKTCLLHMNLFKATTYCERPHIVSDHRRRLQGWRLVFHIPLSSNRFSLYSYEGLALYRLSFLWYSAACFFTTFIVGIVVSYIFPGMKCLIFITIVILPFSLPHCCPISDHVTIPLSIVCFLSCQPAELTFRTNSRSTNQNRGFPIVFN
jgi:hypothetical protein